MVLCQAVPRVVPGTVTQVLPVQFVSQIPQIPVDIPSVYRPTSVPKQSIQFSASSAGIILLSPIIVDTAPKRSAVVSVPVLLILTRHYWLQSSFACIEL